MALLSLRKCPGMAVHWLFMQGRVVKNAVSSTRGVTLFTKIYINASCQRGGFFSAYKKEFIKSLILVGCYRNYIKDNPNLIAG
jgi:hypothetical protein